MEFIKTNDSDFFSINFIVKLITNFDFLDFEYLYRCPKNDESDFVVKQLQKYIIFMLSNNFCFILIALMFIDFNIYWYRNWFKVE
jgi:hypothetical protein